MTQADINALNVVKKTLEGGGYHYDYDSDRNVITKYFSLECKLSKYKVFMRCNNDFFSYRAVLEVNADEKKRDDIAELFAYINDNIMFGAVFDLDYSDGEMSVRMSSYYEDGCINEDVVNNCMNYVDSILEKYGDALLMVLFGMATPKEAFYNVKND